MIDVNARFAISMRCDRCGFAWMALAPVGAIAAECIQCHREVPIIAECIIPLEEVKS